MASPRVTIGIPVFNGEAYLSRAIDSVLEQTFTDFELIISDTGSTDSTSQIFVANTLRKMAGSAISGKK